MEPLVNAYWTAKFGTSADEYEDAFAFSPNSRHFAIADGATESSFADRWARSLVQMYSKEPPSPTGGKLPLPEWVKPLQKEWHDNIKWDALPWFAEEKARMGAFATFLGISFSSPAARKNGYSLFARFRKKEPDKLKWRACAIGDSCLFHIRDNQLVKSFPLSRSEQFQSRPTLLCSNPENNGPVWKTVQTAEGDCRQGDEFFALTDALAKWFLAEVEAGRKPWSRLNELRNASAFEAFVKELRSTKALRNDDTTMLSLQWSNEIQPARTTFSSKK
jgi:hypothetical protein